MVDRRQSPRIARTVPLTLSGSEMLVPAESSVINAHGALIISPKPFYAGAQLVVTNRKNKEVVNAWVVRSSPSADKPGKFDLGVQFQEPSPKFWGNDYTV